MEKVTFLSESVPCAAFLGLPPAPARQRRPAIVLGHGFGIRKESLIEVAEQLTDAGFVTLAIDYRTLGESGGEPRGSIIPLNQVEDFRNAITFLQQRDDVDPRRIGIWGASFGGGVVIMTAALDQRVRAVVAMAPIVNGRRWLNSVWGSGRFEQLRDIVLADRMERYRTGISRMLPLGGPDLPAVLPLDERGGRQDARMRAEQGRPLLYGTPEITAASVEKVMEWEPDRFIELISPRPLLIVTPGEWDIMHRFEHIRDAYARAGEPKRLIPLPCEQMDVYLPPWRTRAAEHAAAWFQEHLAADAV
jgi:fermentation-respiration switch protein FrsA (DUF1100 family)